MPVGWKMACTEIRCRQTDRQCAVVFTSQSDASLFHARVKAIFAKLVIADHHFSPIPSYDALGWIRFGRWVLSLLWTEITTLTPPSALPLVLATDSTRWRFTMQIKGIALLMFKAGITEDSPRIREVMITRSSRSCDEVEWLSAVQLDAIAACCGVRAAHGVGAVQKLL